MHMPNEGFLQEFRKAGVLAFCAKCGERKSDYRKACKSCGLNPRKDNRLLARSILMSTEQYYIQSTTWKARTPKENADFIEREIVPALIDHATLLKDGKEVNFGYENENRWMQRIESEKGRKLPKSLGCFMVVLYTFIIGIIFLFVRRFFF